MASWPLVVPNTVVVLLMTALSTLLCARSMIPALAADSVRHRSLRIPTLWVLRHRWRVLEHRLLPRSFAPVCIDPPTLRAGVAEGHRAIMRSFDPSGLGLSDQVLRCRNLTFTLADVQPECSRGLSRVRH